jgi:PKD domain
VPDRVAALSDLRQAGADRPETGAAAPPVNPQPGCPFTYSWSFGDGASASTATATHTYTSKGSGSEQQFIVTLAVSAFGAPQTWTGTVTVVVH